MTFLLLFAMLGNAAPHQAQPAGKSVTMPDRNGPASLVGTEWKLDNLCGVKVLGGVQATLSFPGPGSAVGNASCNRFFATVKQERESISFSRLGSTRMACEEAVSEQESKYLSALVNAQRFQRKKSYLLIYSKGEDKPLHFHRNYVAAQHQT